MLHHVYSLMSHPDAGGSKLLRNLGQFLSDYMAQYPRRQSSHLHTQGVGSYTQTHTHTHTHTCTRMHTYSKKTAPVVSTAVEPLARVLKMIIAL
jgi:hypothetical protein